MKWKNLKENKCPKCDKGIAGYHFFPGEIMKHPCGFTIRVKRWSEIVNSQVNEALERKLDEEFGEQYV